MNLQTLYEGKRVLVFGLANERSIAWGITQALHGAGAELAFTFAGEALERRVRPLAESVGSDRVFPCDVTDDAQVDAAFDEVARVWTDGFDVLIHSVAFANRQDLDGRFIDTPREGFRIALDVSVYSLLHLTRLSAPMLRERRGNVLTLSYYGAEKVVPNYNIMGVAKSALESTVRYLAADLGPEGVRVNAISAGPIKTLAASGVRGFKTLLGLAEERAPLRRNVTQLEVGQAALFLCSDLATGVTGEIMHVDAGYNVVAI
jgi:enoyl-[acyl-carrier protein] reductase I